MPLFRCAFKLWQPRKQVTRARFYGCGLGYYEPRLNGAKLGTQVLAESAIKGASLLTMKRLSC